MTEYFSESVVLNREPSGDLDSRVSIFTKRFGKLIAKAKSARKITSKLSQHLEPGNLVYARLVEKNGLQLVDALKTSRLKVCPADLYFLGQLLAEAEPDLRLWETILQPEFNWPRILKILGWDPKATFCQTCNENAPVVFHIPAQEFFCKNCSLKFNKNELLYINARQ